MPRTAVHIVTYNSAATIATCLEALLAQDDDFSVLVIDNASQDETVSIVESFGVEVHCNTENTGYAAAHNQAIQQTNSEYVLTLNPDVKLTAGFLQAIRCALEENPKAGSATGLLLRVEGLDEAPQIIDSMGLYMRRNLRQGLRGDSTPITEQRNTIDRVFGPDGAAGFYRRAMLDDIAIDGEVFDEDFYIHKEDVDVCFRALLYGWESLYVPDAVAHHIRHFRPGQRQRVTNQYLRHCAVRNRYLLMMKDLPMSLFWRFALPILWYDVKIFGYLLLLEQKSLPALWDAWQMRDVIFKKRAVVQSRRTLTDDELARWFL